jgi:RHS repeat-associated protein
VSAQGKMKYANENIYIMDVEQIEILSSTDTADIAYLPKSTISPGGSYKMSGFSASTTVAIAGPGSFIYGHQGSLYSRELDFKRYELKDLPKAFGIGNVRVVISDVKEPNATYDQFTADLKAYYNYYAFGMLQPNRHYTLAEEYKFGFNGQEVEDDISGDNNHLVFTYRLHDARLGRFFAVDPLAPKYPHWSPYQFAGLTPIWARELEGLEPWIDSETNDVQFGPYTIEHMESEGYEPAVEVDVLIYSQENAPLTDGGKLAGHVMVGFPFTEENAVYAFSDNKHGEMSKLFPSQTKPSGYIQKETNLAFEHRAGERVNSWNESLEVFTIYTTIGQRDALLNDYESSYSSTPDHNASYDYAVAGYRCASSALKGLNNYSIINLSNSERAMYHIAPDLFNLIKAPYPIALGDYLRDKGY